MTVTNHIIEKLFKHKCSTINSEQHFETVEDCHSSRSLHLYKKFRHLDHCVQDIPSTMQSPCSKLVCTLHMEVEEAN